MGMAGGQAPHTLPGRTPRVGRTERLANGHHPLSPGKGQWGRCLGRGTVFAQYRSHPTELLEAVFRCCHQYQKLRIGKFTLHTALTQPLSQFHAGNPRRSPQSQPQGV